MVPLNQVRFFVAAAMVLGMCASGADRPARSYEAGMNGTADFAFTGTNADGFVVVSAATNSDGSVRITSFLPPDHDWRLRVAGAYCGLTYYGATAPAGSQGTWLMAFGHSMRVRLHIYVLLSSLLALTMLFLGALWRLARKTN